MHKAGLSKPLMLPALVSKRFRPVGPSKAEYRESSPEGPLRVKQPTLPCVDNIQSKFYNNHVGVDPSPKLEGDTSMSDKHDKGDKGDKQEQVMQLLESRAEAITNELNHNWLWQFFLGAFGLIYLRYPDVASSIQKAIEAVKDLSGSLLIIALPIWLVYLFMKFGYILTYFLHVRALYDDHAKAFYSRLSEEDVQFLGKRHTSFEPVYYLAATPKFAKWAIFPSLFSASVVVLNHVAAFGLVAQWKSAAMRLPALWFLAALLTVCYIEFYIKQAKGSRMRKIAVFLYAFSVVAVLRWNHWLL